MNPYASYLGTQDPVTVLSATALRLQQIAGSLGEKRIAAPLAPGKWSPREVFIHLADCELAFGFRYRQALAEDNHLVQPFDQDGWAKTDRKSTRLNSSHVRISYAVFCLK